MEKLTDLKNIKDVTKSMARAVPIKKDNMFGIAIHPFTNSVYWNDKMMDDMSTDVEKYDLSNPRIYDEWTLLYSR